MLSPDDFPHQIYPDDSAQRRNPGADSQCRRNPLCVRGLRHRGLGGPCRLSGEPGVLPKRPSGKQKLKGRKPGSRSGPSGRSGRRKPKHDVEVDDEEEGEEEEEEETHYEGGGGGGGGGGSSRAGGGDGQRARPTSTRQIKKTTIPGRVGHAIVGRTIEVFWQADGWQEGRVLSYNPATGKHTVEYTHQGAIEQLTLAKEQWRQDEPETEYDSSEEDEEGEEGEGGEEGEEGEEGDDGEEGDEGDEGEEEGEEGEEGAMASEADVPDGGVEALLAMSALVNAAIKVRNPGKARESGRGLPRVSVKEGRAGASGKLPKGVAPASKRAPTSAPTAQRTASAGAELGSGAALARIGSISGDRGGGRAEAELSFEPMHLELTNVKPQWLMVQLTQNTVQGARRRVKSLPDAWLGVHLANRPTACIGDAERCCPIPKLSPGGQLCIRQADLAGLADGLYQFALYSRHLCVASTLAIRFRQNRFTDEIYEPNCEPADDEEPTMAPAEGKRRRGAGGAKRQRVTSRSARRAKGAKVRRAAGSLAADAEDDAEEEVSDLGGGESEEGEGEEEDERPNPLLAAVTALASGRGLGAEEVDEPEDEGHAAASSGGAPEDDEAEGEVDEEALGHADAEMEAEAADGDELAAAEEGAVMGGGLAAQSDEDGVLGAVLGAVMDED
jgi:hypothetical protein